MTHFLRDLNNDTIAEVQTWGSAKCPDLSFSLNVGRYSRVLLSKRRSPTAEAFVGDFACLSEIRGIFFEEQKGKGAPDKLAAKMMEPMAERWGLWYVTD